MIQVYKKNDLFVIENTITETIYPNLTREETVELLKKFDRDEPEDRCDFAMKEDSISFEYASLDDKERKSADLEAKLAESEEKKESYRLQNEQHHLQLLQFYSRLGVEAFGADIHEKALETLMIMKEQLAEKDAEIKQLKLDLGMFRSVNEFLNGYGIEKAREVLLQTEKTKQQDKISFALEQLEKVRNEIHGICFFTCDFKCDEIMLEKSDKIIDNQIKELKGEK